MMKLQWQNIHITRLTLLGILLIFWFQHFILYYSLYYLNNVKHVLYNIIWDALLSIYILHGLISQNFMSSVRFALLWSMYSITIAIKMVILVYVAGRTVSTVDIRGLSFDISGMFYIHILPHLYIQDTILSIFGFYITPLVHSMLNNASKNSLFSIDVINVTVDEMLHSDLGLATTIDLWDVMLMYSHLIKSYKEEVRKVGGGTFVTSLFISLLVLVLLVVFLLGLSFPTVDGDTDETVYMEKYGVKYFLSEVFSWLRGLCSFNLKRFIQSEEDDNAIDYHDDWYLVDNTYKVKRNKSCIMDVVSSDNFKSHNKDRMRQALDMFTMAKFTFIIGFFLIDLPFSIYRLYILIKYNTFSLLLYKNFLFLILRPYRLNLSQLAERDSAKGWQAAFFEGDSMAGNLMESSKQNYIHDDLKLLNESSTESESEFLKKLTHKATFRSRKSFKGVTDPAPRRLLTKMASKIIEGREGVTLTGGNRITSVNEDDNALIFRGKSNKFPNIPFENEDDDKPLELNEENIEAYKISLLKILKRNQILPLKNVDYDIIIKHFRDFLFGKTDSFGKKFIRNVENFNLDEMKSIRLCNLICIIFTIIPRILIVVIIFSCTEPVRTPRTLFLQRFSDLTFLEVLPYSVLFISSFIITCSFFYTKTHFLDVIFILFRDVINLLSLLTCVCVFKDSVPPGHLFLYIFSCFLFLLWPILLIKEGLFNRKDDKKMYSIKLIYTLCKFSIAPISYNYKLCSLDLIESIKIQDSLLHTQWSHLIYRSIFRILCCSISDSKASISIILFDLIIGLIYTVFSQSLRALVFRKFEVHYIVLRIMGLIKHEWESSHEYYSKPEQISDEYFNHCITLADIDKYIKVQGLLSSPGVIVPAFL